MANKGSHVILPQTKKQPFKVAVKPYIGALRVLGLKKPYVLRIPRTGLPVKSFAGLEKALGVPHAELAKILAISPRTLLRRQVGGELNLEESDRLIRIADVFAKTLDLFDQDEAAARAWFLRPAPALDGATPLQHSNSHLGAAAVLVLIEQLQEGVFP